MPRPVSHNLGAWLAAATIGLLTTTTSIESVRAGEDKALSLADLAGSYSVGKAGLIPSVSMQPASPPTVQILHRSPFRLMTPKSCRVP